MLGHSTPFGSFSTDSAARALEFYRDALGLDATLDETMGQMVWLHHPHGGETLIYEKPDHVPASHTVLMFRVDDVETLAVALRGAGVTLEAMDFSDDDGVARDPEGRMPSTLWFKDPAGNWLSAMQAEGGS
ncbi:VOC family protein [Demequina sp. NBRC 110054]|uniref:VOC family protein n=1 Tax=Demequina sp. NBRC 110054 TaxID=1570343 RepID=UPI0009FC13CD|nr:VOC family protein [Demequina sp. NBRC 110054]